MRHSIRFLSSSLYIPKKVTVPSRDGQLAFSSQVDRMLPLSSLFGSEAQDTTSHVFRVAQTHRKLTEGRAQESMYGGLQLHLPPLFTWPDHTKLLCEHINSYVTSAALAAAAARNASSHSNSSSRSSDKAAVVPPAVLFLRLFPDCTVARLSNPNAVAATQSSSSSSSSFSSSARSAHKQRRMSAQQQRPVHTLPLEAFGHAEQPWGTGIDPHAIHQHALRTLQQIANQFGSQYVLVLILPTRLLVSQQFCHDLIELLSTRLGWVNIAFELPSTSSLLAPDQSDAAPSWCRLSLLTTPWDQLQRHAAYSSLLRHHLSKRTLLPLHVLLPWIMERQMLAKMEVGLVVDTVPPRGREEKNAAFIEDRFYTQRHQDAKTSRRLREAEVEHKRKTMRQTRSGEKEEVAESDAVHTFFSDNAKRQRAQDGQRRTYEAATNAVRARDAAVREQNEENSRRAATRAAEKVWHMHTKTPPNVDVGAGDLNAATAAGGAAASASPLLSLDTPSDELKRLIMQSITSDDDDDAQTGSKRSTLEQTGQLLSSVCTSASDDATPNSNASSLWEVTSTLEDLLRSPEEKLRAAQEAAQRELRLRSPVNVAPSHSTEFDALFNRGGDGGAAAADISLAHMGCCEPVYGEGYWDCMAALQQLLPVTYTMGMPTWHTAQVQQWRSEYEAHMRRAVSLSNEPLPFVHATLPVLNPATLEAQRRLREGNIRKGEEPTDHEEDLNGWLPKAVRELAEETLRRLPKGYVRREANAPLRNYEPDTLFGTDSVAARGGGSVLQRHGSGTGGGADEDDETSFTIRRKHFLRPFWYMHPANVAAQHEEAIASLERQKEHHLRADASSDRRSEEEENETRFGRRGGERASTEISSYANRIDVRQVERTFKRQLLSDVVRAQRKGPDADNKEKENGVSVVVLSVPPPGVSEEDLQESWNAFLAHE